MTGARRGRCGRVGAVRYTVQVPMRWSDMDAYGHVNNVVFLQYFEMARVDLFFERASLEERTGLRRGTVVAAHDIQYKLPVVYSPRPLDVQIWVSEVRAAAFRCPRLPSPWRRAPWPRAPCGSAPE